MALRTVFFIVLLAAVYCAGWVSHRSISNVQSAAARVKQSDLFAEKVAEKQVQVFMTACKQYDRLKRVAINERKVGRLELSMTVFDAREARDVADILRSRALKSFAQYKSHEVFVIDESTGDLY